MRGIDQMFAEAARKNADGTSTIGETVNFGFYRLLEGEHGGKVVIKTTARIDDKSILYFANAMTWIYTEKLKDVRCERVTPTFDTCCHPVDMSKSQWFDDNGNKHVPSW